MKTFAFIFARGGSKGLPKKNIREFNGKPLIAYSILLAKQLIDISKVFVSTDDKDIANVGVEYGADIISRPEELARDDSPEWLAWRHAIEWVEAKSGQFDRFVSLPTTSPLRSVDDVGNCLNKLDESTDIVVTLTDTSRSPFFNMVQEEDGYVRLLVDGTESYSRRQDVPKAFDMTTVAYVTRPKFILEKNAIFQGRVKSVLIPSERAIDIDTQLDFDVAEFLMKNMEKTIC